MSDLLPAPLPSGHVPAPTFVLLDRKKLWEKYQDLLKAPRFDDYLSSENLVRLEALILKYLHFIRYSSINTQEQYLSHLCDFFNFLKKGSDLVNDWDVERYIEHLVKQRKLKPRSIKTILAPVRSYYDYLKNAGVHSSNPAKLVRPPKYEDNQISEILEKALSFDEVDQAMSVLEKDFSLRDLTMFYLMARAAPRVSEVIALTWSCFALAQGKWSLRVLGKGNKERLLVLPDKAVYYLMLYRQALYGITPGSANPPAIAGMPIFPVYHDLSKHMCRKNVNKIMTNIWVASGIKKFSPHALRHTCLTHMSLKKATLEEIKLVGNHAKADTSFIYINAGKILTEGLAVFNE